MAIQPAAPAMAAHRQLSDQRHRDQPGQLRQGGDRGRGGAAPDEPVVDRAVDPEINGLAQFIRATQNEQVEHQQRLGPGKDGAAPNPVVRMA